MAKPIEPTPILTGEDAKELLNEVVNARYDRKKEEFLKDCDKVYEVLSKNKR